ncbi:DUF3291 domain-containing protein [Streptomyces verrucosisporus]|uniref:DUF3291 domain-containing protein n=1 Tax=Streptomyces verrucosisporus TaxID=1695161 RepID=UPI0019D07CF9|nr:DUF3291 domain-containing protein [Streptomyces verrucosisporus]MBN3932683.1 DUF3291 domain-containing protein [Streptomyces verrucosisporus]
MPKLPWTTISPADPADEAVVMASRLEVASLRHVPRFFWFSLVSWRQVRRSPGAFGASLIAQLGRGVFWTLSAWESREALYAYAKTEPHNSIMKRLRPTMRESHFVFWTVPAERLPISWEDARARLAEERDRKS